MTESKIDTFEKLEEFLISKKTSQLQRNYQSVVIKSLLENNYVLSKDKAIEFIKNHNAQLKEKSEIQIPVFDVLGDEVIHVDKEAGRIELYVKNLTSEQKNKLIKYCDEWIFNVKTRHELNDLEKLGVPELHIRALRWYLRRRGRTYSRDQLSKGKKHGKLPEDELLTDEQILHGMVKGVYKPKGDDFGQCILLNPKTKWEMELIRNHDTIHIEYNFRDPVKYADQIKWVNKCHAQKIPLGIVFRLDENKYKCLGLGKIISVDDTKYVVESYGISPEESKSIKDETLSEYDSYNTDPQIKKIPKIDWNELVNNVNPEEERFRKLRTSSDTLERKPTHIDEVIKSVNDGSWTVPNFQRYFVWKSNQVKEFLNSVFHNYYVGSLLLWKVDGRQELDIIPVEGAHPEKLRNDIIILDGQQRVTSLNYAINPPDKVDKDKMNFPGYFYIDFGAYLHSDEMEDIILSTEKQIDERDSYEQLLFPFYKLNEVDMHRWIEGLMNHLEQTRPDMDQRKINKISSIIRDKLLSIYNIYEIPRVELKSTDFDIVATIFEKINSTGVPLGTFELLIVRLARFKVHLKNLWEDSLKHYKKIREYYKESPEIKDLHRYIMESISLSHTQLKSCKRKDILDLYQNNKEDPTSFEKKWKEMSRYLEMAIEYLEKKEGFGVYTRKVLPYEPMIPILTSLLREIDTTFKKDQPQCLEKLQNWYWTSVFDVRYSQSVEAKKSSDFKDMIEWFTHDNKIPKYVQTFRENFMHMQLRESRNERESVYRGIFCLLYSKGATDFEMRISADKTPHMDHIFPKSKFKKYGLENSILNMTWLTEDTNVKTKKARTPSEYISEIKNTKYRGKEDFSKVLDSHMINAQAFQCMIEDDFRGFIEAREGEMLKEIAKRIGASFTELDRIDTDSDNIYLKSISELLQMDESLELEFKATSKFDLRQQQPSKIMQHEILETIAGFMNSYKGGLLIIGYDDDNDTPVGVEKDYPYMGNRKNWDGWLSNLNNLCKEYLGQQFVPYIAKIEPISYQDVTLAKIRIKPSNNAVYLEDEFYLRQHGQTNKLKGRAREEYIKNRFGI